MSLAAWIIKYIEQDLPIKISSWLAYLFIPYIGLIVLSLHSFTCWILTIAIYSGHFFGIQMVDQFMTKEIPAIVGEKEQDLYLIGHVTNVVTTATSLVKE
jgi:hypothetical protein